MPDPNASLAALVGSRLCHDLISPVGAIQNGLELLSMAGGAPGPELDLIQDSCDSATARIRFFRVAFGAADSEQMVSGRDIADTLEGLCKGGRTMAVWDAYGDYPRSAVQLVYLAFLCCESALPTGGTVRITQENDSWRIDATAPRLKVEPALWQVLEGGDQSCITADKVHFALLAHLAQTAGRPLNAGTHEGVVSISLGAA